MPKQRSAPDLATVAEPAAPTEFTPPAVPDLTPDEVDRAIKSAGLAGVLKLMLAKVEAEPGLAERHHLVLAHAHARSAVVAENLLMSYRSGAGIPHGEATAMMGRAAFGAECLAATLRHVGQWIIDNPGQFIDDIHGNRRVFT